MTGLLQGNLSAARLFSVVEHSSHLKQRALKLCLPEEPDNPALLLPGSQLHRISSFPTVSFKDRVTESYEVRKATCEHAVHASAFRRRQNHTHSHRKLHTKFKIPKGKEA